MLQESVGQLVIVGARRTSTSQRVMQFIRFSRHVPSFVFQPFCKPCHLKAFGPKGYGYGGSVGGDYVDRSSPLSLVRKMATSSTQEWTPPRVDTPLYLQSDRDAESANGEEMDRPDSPFSSSSTTTAATSTGRSSPFRTNSNSGASSNTCRRCGETCYFAEQVCQNLHMRLN